MTTSPSEGSAVGVDKAQEWTKSEESPPSCNWYLSGQSGNQVYHQDWKTTTNPVFHCTLSLARHSFSLTFLDLNLSLSQLCTCNVLLLLPLSEVWLSSLQLKMPEMSSLVLNYRHILWKFNGTYRQPGQVFPPSLCIGETHLESRIQVWAPQHKTDMDWMEWLQQRTTKVIKGLEDLKRWRELGLLCLEKRCISTWWG